MKKLKELIGLFFRLDPFSKIILILILTIIAALTIEGVTKFNPNGKKATLRQFSTTYKLEVEDYYFNSGFKSRLAMDNTLIIKLLNSLSKEEFRTLSFEISPSDSIRSEYIDDKTIKIYFDNKMPQNENKNTLLIIKNEEIVNAIVFSNTNFDENYYKGLNELKVVPSEE